MIFDIWRDDKNEFMHRIHVATVLLGTNLRQVPSLYIGDYNAKVLKLAVGKTTINKADHMREGIVIKSWIEEVIPNLGRKILKVVADDYTTRENGTEFA